eukprot:7808535-Ditylum_brightwellii.AAC.1
MPTRQYFEAQMRRIASLQLWENGKVSYNCLRNVVKEYCCDDEKVCNVMITYSNEDGNTIIISTNEELADAFGQFTQCQPPVLPAKKYVTKRSQKKKRAALSSSFQLNKAARSSSTSSLNGGRTVPQIIAMLDSTDRHNAFLEDTASLRSKAWAPVAAGAGNALSSVALPASQSVPAASSSADRHTAYLDDIELGAESGSNNDAKEYRDSNNNNKDNDLFTNIPTINIRQPTMSTTTIFDVKSEAESDSNNDDKGSRDSNNNKNKEHDPFTNTATISIRQPKMSAITISDILPPLQKIEI